MKKSFEPSLFKNKTTIGIVCIAAALLIGFVFVPMANNAANADVSVVRAKQDIPAGTQITAAMLETVKMGKTSLPNGAALSVSAVTGKFAAVDITQDDIITPAKTAESGGMYDLGNGQYLISITIRNFADGLSGKLQRGDIVTAFVTSNDNSSSSSSSAPQGTAAATCPPELRYVKVAAVTASSGKDTDANQLQTAKTSGTNGSSDNLPATVTLLVNQRQAQVLAALDKNEIHLALVCRANSTKAKALLDAQNAYFKGAASQAADNTAVADTTASDTGTAASSDSAGNTPNDGSKSGVQQSATKPQVTSVPQAPKAGTVSK